MKNQNKKLFILFLLSFFSTILVTNNKLYVLLFVIFASILFFYFKRPIFETIFLTFVLSLPFENTIREWIYQITPQLFDNVTTSGYVLYFGITIKLILAITIFLFLFLNKKILNKQTKILTPEIIFLLFFFIIACVNTFFNRSTIGPIFGLIRIWISVLIFIVSRIFFTENKKIFFVFIASLYLFCISIGTLQLIKQKPLGKYIELTPSFNQEFGYSTTDGEKQYRVSGFISHPVYFASFLSIILPIYLGIVLDQFQKKSNSSKIIIILTLITGCFIILGTLSRSAFFTLLLSLFLMKNIIFKKIIKPIFNTKTKKLFYLIIFVLICLTIVFITPRINSFKLLFTENGNASIRLELIKESLKMIYQNPLGVGLNNFTTELVKSNISSSLYGFIVPVHNTFLIFFTELGILGGFFFILFLFSIFLKNFSKNKTDIVNYGIWIGILSFIINSQIHPLFNLDPTFDLLMLVLAYYSVNKHVSE